MDIKKLTTLLAYLSEKLGPTTKLKAVKLLYFIDKAHLLEYGRFVTDDTYVKLPYGPVPTRILDIINEKEALFENEKTYLNQYLKIENNKNRTMHCKKTPDLEELSKSELKVIDQVIAQYGKLSLGKLLDESHKEKAWLNAEPHNDLSIEDMISDLPQEKKKELAPPLKD